MARMITLSRARYGIVEGGACYYWQLLKDKGAGAPRSRLKASGNRPVEPAPRA